MNSIGKTNKLKGVTGRDMASNSITTSVLNGMHSIGDKQSCHAVTEKPVENTEVNSAKY